MLVLEHDDPVLYARFQELNLLRQYDMLTNFIEVGLKQGSFSFDKYILWALNHVAVAGISQHGGRFRKQPVYVNAHRPPPFWTVPAQMDLFISFIHENWFKLTPTQVAAYGLWRLNWIHPFVDGNGRTARAACYYLLCARSGNLLGGRKTVPERIRENREPYYAALQQADRAWDKGDLDFSALEAYLAELLQAQLSEANIET